MKLWIECRIEGRQMAQFVSFVCRGQRPIRCGMFGCGAELPDANSVACLGQFMLRTIVSRREVAVEFRFLVCGKDFVENGSDVTHSVARFVDQWIRHPSSPPCSTESQRVESYEHEGHLWSGDFPIRLPGRWNATLPSKRTWRRFSLCRLLWSRSPLCRSASLSPLPRVNKC